MAGRHGPSGGLAEAGRSSGQPGARSGADRGLRRASWPRPEPPYFLHIGAAYNYAPLGAATAPLVERVEMRAFGCLAEELATRTSTTTTADTALQAGLLLLAQQVWMAPDVAARPGFAEARAQLEALGGAYRSSL